jgi:hypothetical protein
MRAWWVHPPGREPDKNFIEDLKQLDECLMVYWDARENDWVIVRHGNTGDHEVAHYKYLDNRVLKSLDDGDLRKRTPKQWEEYIDSVNNKIKSDKLKQVHESNMEFGRRTYVDSGIREHKTQF